jgi:HSP20 family protein
MTTYRLNNAFPTLFDNLFNAESDFLPKNNYKSLPAVNVLETKEGFELEIAAPGLAKEDFKIKVEQNKLTISSEKQKTTDSTDTKYTRKEFGYESFVRSFVLPNTVDSDKIVATYSQGILQVAVGKKEEAKQKEPKLIEIA